MEYRKRPSQPSSPSGTNAPISELHTHSQHRRRGGIAAHSPFSNISIIALLVKILFSSRLFQSPRQASYSIKNTEHTSTHCTDPSANQEATKLDRLIALYELCRSMWAFKTNHLQQFSNSVHPPTILVLCIYECCSYASSSLHRSVSVPV